MAKVLILCSVNNIPNVPFSPWKHSTEFLLKHAAELDRFGRHTVTDDPAEADIILFAEMSTCGIFAELIRRHPYYKCYTEKCFAFDTADFFFPVLPGIYASLSKDHYRLGGMRTGFYLYLIENAFITHRPCSGNEQYLASFVGSSNTRPVREKLFQIQRSDFFLKDTSSYSYWTTYHAEPSQRACFWTEYADAIANAKFSLCPRGQGTSSIRLFESMKMGRACVILADDWQPNHGIRWDEFSITIPERDASLVPEILALHASRAAEMGARARQVWEENFSERVLFHRIVELCLDIRNEDGNGRFARRRRLLRHTANPRNWRWYVSSKFQLYRTYGKRYYW